MRQFSNQFDFQHACSKGRILNVGCDADTSHLKKKRGAVNVDIWERNPYTGMACPIDLIADCRCLPADFEGKFDTVILGDILEHFVSQDDVLLALGEAERCLAPDGVILISCPEDHRDPDSQGFACQSGPMYTHGVRAFHAYPVTREIMDHWLDRANFEAVEWVKINYPFTPHGGHGVVARPLGPVAMGEAFYGLEEGV